MDYFENQEIDKQISSFSEENKKLEKEIQRHQDQIKNYKTETEKLEQEILVLKHSIREIKQRTPNNNQNLQNAIDETYNILLQKVSDLENFANSPEDFKNIGISNQLITQQIDSLKKKSQLNK